MWAWRGHGARRAPRHPDSSLVRMGERGLEELLFEGFGKPIEGLIRVLKDLLDRGGADRESEEILAHPGEAVEGEGRVDMGVNQPPFKVGTVLDGNDRLCRKGGLDRLPATGTAPEGTAVFGRNQPLGGKVQDLSRGNGQGGLLLERPGISAGATLRSMDNDPVWTLDRREGLSGMSLLPSRLSAAGRMKTLGMGCAVAVR